MKKVLIFSLAIAFALSSCKKDHPNQSSTNFSGVESAADLKAPAGFDWRTTKEVSIDISTLASEGEKQIKIFDLEGHLLLNRLTAVETGDKLDLQLPLSQKELILTHNGIQETVKINSNTGSILTQKSGGYPSNAPCPCDGRMENVTFQYSGSTGATLTVWYKDKGNSKSKSHTFANLTTGDIISVNGFTTSGNSGKTPRLEAQTFLSLNNGGSYWNVHTSCSEYILGNVYGPFKVIAFTDGNGQTCSDQCVDSDNDGCCDEDDAFPNDPTKCDIQYIPGENVYGSYAFEDLWPSTGDFDFNDKVIDRTTSLIIDQNGEVSSAQYKFVLRAAGAGFSNGFGFSLPNTIPADVLSVSSSLINPGDYTQIDAKGLEMNQSKAVVILYEDWNNIVDYTQYGTFFNTVTPGPGISAGVGFSDTITVDIAFSIPQQVSDMLEIDPFLIQHRTRDIEVHLPWFGPTDLASPIHFNTFNDASAYPNSGNNYVTSNNIPWAIETPLSAFEWPQEKIDITTVYYDFASWAMTSSPANWYSNGNRDASKIY